MKESVAKKTCVACGERIQQQARRCPYCHSLQKPDKVGLIATITKWCGGIAVVLSVVLGVGDLTRVTDSWLEDDIYAEQLAEAAEIAMQQEDFAIAGVLLKEAAALKPSSSEVRSSQVKLAMLTVRKKFAVLTQDGFEPVNEAYTILYKNLDFDDRMRNDVMAHIGWAAVLLDKPRPGYYFDQVLAGEPENVYALVFKTTWLLTGRFDSISASERFKTAKALFQKGKDSERHQSFIVDWYLYALSRHSSGAAAEYIRTVIREHDVIATFGFPKVKNIRREIDSLMMQAIRKSAVQNDALFDSLFAHLDERELEQLLGFVAASGDLQQRVTADVLKGLYQARKGDLTSALAAYGVAMEVYENGKLSSAQVVANALPNLIKRACERLDESASDSLCRAE